jgi:hypothetical protein
MIKGTVASGQNYNQLHDARMISKDNSERNLNLYYLQSSENMSHVLLLLRLYAPKEILNSM